MTSRSFQTAVQKNEAKLSSFVQFGDEMASYRALIVEIDTGINFGLRRTILDKKTHFF